MYFLNDTPLKLLLIIANPRHDFNFQDVTLNLSLEPVTKQMSGIIESRSPTASVGTL